MKELKQLDLYISFVKECFRQETSDGERWKGMDWEEFFLFTQKQAVAGYIFEHIKRYKRDAIGIPEETLLNWFAYHDEIANRNKKVNQYMCEVVRDFSNSGLRTCILKGQGNAMLYPTPLSRMPGDIDIWVDADRKEIVDFAKAKGTSCIMCHEQPSIEKLQRTGVIVIDDDDKVLDMEEKPQVPKTHWAVPPFYIYMKKDLDLIRHSVENGCGKDAPGNLAHYMVEHTDMHAWHMTDGRFDIGSIDTYKETVEKYGNQ